MFRNLEKIEETDTEETDTEEVKTTTMTTTTTTTTTKMDWLYRTVVGKSMLAERYKRELATVREAHAKLQKEHTALQAEFGRLVAGAALEHIKSNY